MEGDNSSEQIHQSCPSFEAFDRALGAAVVACDQLPTATWGQDIVRAELAVRAAVASWLQAGAELRRLEPREFRGPRWRIAAFAFAANGRAIIEALGHTRRMFSDPRLRDVLDHLAQMVARAAGENRHETDAKAAD